MAVKKRSKVSVDIKKNRLQVSFVGKITKKMLSDLYTDIRFSVADLKPGFDVVADFLDAQVIVLNSIPTFQKITHFVASSGAGNVVRILDTERLAETQLGNLLIRVQGYRPIIAESIEEAEEKLEILQKRDGMRIYLHHTPVEYQIGEEKGDGDIYNISVSGIAVQDATKLPDVGTELSFTISFPNQKDENEIFEVKANTVRVEGESFFAAQFTGLEEDVKGRLWKVLLKEALEEMV